LPETHASLARLHPLGRMGEVRGTVEAVLYVESDAFVTGEALHVGGQRRGSSRVILAQSGGAFERLVLAVSREAVAILRKKHVAGRARGKE
jgi:hypothetical protein